MYKTQLTLNEPQAQHVESPDPHIYSVKLMTLFLEGNLRKRGQFEWSNTASAWCCGQLLEKEVVEEGGDHWYIN